MANKTSNAVLFFADKTLNKTSAYKAGSAGYCYNLLATVHFYDILKPDLINSATYTHSRADRMISRSFSDFYDPRSATGRNIYTIELDAGFSAGGLIKHDLQQSRKETYNEGMVRHFMEPVFVPRQDSTSEDDGWLMSFVYGAERESSDVVILEAKDMAAGPAATIHLPRRVPFGFHGNWIPSTD